MATDTTGSDAAHGATEAVGMPQLDFTTFPNQIFWLIVALVAIYFLLSRVALPRIAMVLAERRGTISNDIAAAEEYKAQAVEAEQAYDKALADARAESQRIIAEAKAEIQKELDAAMAHAEAEISARTAESAREIEGIRATARENVEIVARDAAAALIASFGGQADDSTIADAVNAQMKG